MKDENLKDLNKNLDEIIEEVKSIETQLRILTLTVTVFFIAESFFAYA